MFEQLIDWIRSLFRTNKGKIPPVNPPDPTPDPPVVVDPVDPEPIDPPLVDPSPDIPALIDRVQLTSIMPGARADRIDLYLDYLNLTLSKFDITSPLRIAHFMAQIAHESGSFNYNEEIWPNPQLDANGVATNGSSWQLRYENNSNLGNTQPGDGYRFRGRGLIQLTGRFNYKQYSQSQGINFTINGNEQLVALPEFAVDVAGWFWNGRNLNRYADQDDVQTITRRINGGTNGLAQREAFLKRAKEALQLPV